MRLGMIGLKGHQSVVLAGIKKLDGWQIAGIADSDRPVADRLKSREPLAKEAVVFDDWRRLLDHCPVDCVCLCGENGERAEQLLALAKLNVHVVSEKPLTTTLDDLAKVRAAWAKSKGRLTMLLTMRHEPKYAEARRLIQAGTIGEPVLASSQKSYQLDARPDWFRSKQRLGGTIPYIGIHPVDLMRWVTGLEYTHAAAFHGAQGHRAVMGETESQASVLLKFANGGTATTHVDYLRPKAAKGHGDDRLHVAGTEGVIDMVGASAKVTVVTATKAQYEVEPPAVANLFVAFWEAIQKGEPSPIPADDCFRVTEVVLKAREAAERGTMVELK